MSFDILRVQLHSFLRIPQSLFILTHEFVASSTVGKKYTFGIIELLGYQKIVRLP